MRCFALALLCAAFAPSPGVVRAASSVPAVTVSQFASLPALLVDFEDSDNILLLDDTGAVSLSTNEGAAWSKVAKITHPISNLLLHPHAKASRALALTESTTHYMTTDAGKTWSSFSSEYPLVPTGLSFHAKELDWILFKQQKVEKSDGWFEIVSEHAYYTKDSFKSSKPLLSYITDCTWAQSHTLTSPDVPKDRILCLQYPASAVDDTAVLTMVSSESYFPKGKGDVIAFADGAAPVALGSSQSFLVTVVNGANEKAGLELYSSTDGKLFSKAYFPPETGVASRSAYTVLDSSEHRLLIDTLPVLSSTSRNAPYGHLYLSDSTGTSFTKSLAYTNRNPSGRTDFERIDSEPTSATLLANVVDNWNELETNPKKPKRVSSRISFDDGATWSRMRAPSVDANGDSWTCNPAPAKSPVDATCALHFHSRTEFHNVGKTFSTISAPGLIIGVGSVGTSLAEYTKSDTFVSTDGGATFTNAARGPHKFEILDSGSLLVLIPDDTSDASNILYSTKRGAPGSWTVARVQPEGLTYWSPIATSIDPDSTSSKMIVIAESASGYPILQLDFTSAEPRRCEWNEKNPSSSTRDFELWTAKPMGQDVCVMGQEVAYYRRKADAECFVGRKFKHPEVKRTPCACARHDFECDAGFRVKEGNGACVQVGVALDQPAECPLGTQYKGSPGYRKIPGDQCEGGETLDGKKMMECRRKGGGGVSKPPGKAPTVTSQVVEDGVEKVMYLKDSRVVLMLAGGGTRVWRSDNEGETWTEPGGAFKKAFPVLLMGAHDVDSSRVFFVTRDAVWMSKDRVATDPVSIETPARYNQLNVQVLDFHPTEPEYLVFVGMKGTCPGVCFTETYLTVDSGRGWLNGGKPVETWATKCVWAWDSGFTGGGGKNSGVGKDAVLCSSFREKNGKVGQDELGHVGTRGNPLQLVLITEAGKKRTVLIEEGVVQFYVVDTVLVVLLENGNSIKLVVSTDGMSFVDTEFPPGMEIEKNGFTVLESKTNGIFLDLAQSLQFGGEFGHLFKSNSNGTFYNRVLEYSNRNDKGFVDFEKMKGIPGVVLANKVMNPMDISSESKRIKSLISYDDGSTWNPLTAPETDSEGNPCSLNIFCKIGGSPDRISGAKASVKSSAHAAGVMVAVGHIGDTLGDYNDANMYLTKDAGRSWTEVRKDAHKWAIGDHGAIIVMVNDEEVTNKLIYSWNYGDSWAEFQFSDTPLRVSSLLTEPSATSLKFVLYGSATKNSETQVITLNFEPVLPRTCDKPKKNGGDFVEWSPAGENGKDRCFLGQDLSFWRRKGDAECHVGREFEDMPGSMETCACVETDFEWFVFVFSVPVLAFAPVCFADSGGSDFNFFRDGNNGCVPYGIDPLQPKNCKPGTSYDGSSGFRKIPLSKCKGGIDLTPKMKRICGDSSTTPGLKITTNLLQSGLSNYFYFNQSSSIMLLDEAGRIYASLDAGQTWSRPAALKAEDYESIVLDAYRSDRRAFLIDEDDTTQWYTDDKGKTFKQFTVPTRANRLGVESLVLHSSEPGYLLWIGEKECDSVVSPNCRTVAYVSTNHGGKWTQVAQYVSKCAFAREPQFSRASRDTIVCQVFVTEAGNQRKMGQRTQRRLVRSVNLGGRWETMLESTISFATAGEYMVAAQLEQDASQMHMYSSLDAVSWTRAKFEDDEKIPDYGYTLLDASTGTAFVEVFSSKETGAEMGTLYKSIDSAGAVYKISLSNVNQDHSGFTDFEKVLGIRGIGLANVVVNGEDVKKGSPKQVRSQITFNDGDLWKPLIPPKVGSDGTSYNCGDDCYLNLHHFTERSDSNDLFSSESAIGFMMGVGNVGSHLKRRNDGNTFLTRDAGLTWTEVAKDAHLYEFGDQGGIILLANDEVAIDEIKYSLNHGKTFKTAKISSELGGGQLRVSNIITEPYGAASTFVVFGSVVGGTREQETAAIKLDFTNVWPRECVFVKGDDAKNDYEAWSPTGEKVGEDSCMLGQQIQYYRRKSDRECHSKGFYEAPITLVKACQCTIDDFTCDIGFAMNSTNQCQQNTGYTTPTPACVSGQLKYTTGYVKIKNTKCVGGVALDVGRVESCAVSISFFGWMGIFALVVGIPAGVSVGVIHLKRGGRIRLPVDDDSFEDARARTQDFAAKAGHVLRSGLILFMGLVEIGLTKAKDGYDWVRNTYNQRTRGYAPVGANYYDVDLETDPDLLFDDE
ncbi:vacuolar protein sorting/targeting protein PEP1 [Podochytrium sp. JEL0797]|nr:vacuolar protein sorting/targeting protein PEP1 [Podochytrium sp. JEL0797]